MERHGDGPKPGLTALAEPRKASNAPKVPVSASSADLQATPEDAGSSPSAVQVSAAASSLPKDPPRGLIQARSWRRRRSSHGPWIGPHPARDPRPRQATPRGTTHRPSWMAPGLGYHSRLSREDAEEAVRRQRL